MSAFLHPWAVWIGLLAAGLPVAIHLLTRPRPKRFALSTVKFLQAAIRDRRARNRLRDLIILGLRTLAVLLLAFAVARPIFDRRAVVSADSGGSVARVVILDVSQSMGAEGHGVRTIERARPAAAAFLSDRPGVRAGVILAGASAETVFDQLSVNMAALRTEVGRVTVRAERLNVAAAIARAGELFSLAPEGIKRELVIVSDFQRTNWAEVDFAQLPADTAIQLESVAPAETPSNLAVLRVSPPHRVEQGREARIEIEVGNFSAGPKQVVVEVTTGDVATRAEGTCGAWGRTTLFVEAPPRLSGWQAGSVRIVGAADSIPADDVRPFVLEVRSPPSFALLTRQPAGSGASSSYYLERAMEPIAPKQNRGESRVTRIDPNQVDPAALAAADVIAIDHPGRLSPDLVRQLVSLLKRGRGVLYVASETQDATNLKLIADAAGADLKLPVEFVPPPGGARRKDLFLTAVNKIDPPFAVFGDGLTSVVNELRFGGGLGTRKKDDGLADDVLATFGDRTAVLVVSGCGEGTLAVLNADLGMSNLPSSPAFVPIVGELTTRLLGRSRAAGVFACGEPALVNLSASAGPASGLTLHGPTNDAGILKEDASGVSWTHARPQAAGVYRVDRQGTTVFAAAVAVPPDESDLRPLDAAVLTDRSGQGRTIGYRSAIGSERDRDTVWSWLVVGCLVCVLSELAALKWFRT